MPRRTTDIGELPVTLMTLALVLIGVGLGVALFRNGTALVAQPAGPVVTAARNNLYGDALNETIFEKPGIYLTRALVYFDNRGTRRPGQRAGRPGSAAAPAGSVGRRPASSARTRCRSSAARCS